MDSITIPALDPIAAARLSARAAADGCSVAVEAQRVLESALGTRAAPEGNLYDRIHARFARIGGVDLDLPPREKLRAPPRFD